MTIAEVLMVRDGMSRGEVDQLISEAIEELNELLEAGEFPPYDFTETWFGLEPDYMDELIHALVY